MFSFYTAGIRKPIYYNGPHELCNFSSGPQKFINIFLKFYLCRLKESKEKKLNRILFE